MHTLWLLAICTGFVWVIATFVDIGIEMHYIGRTASKAASVIWTSFRALSYLAASVLAGFYMGFAIVAPSIWATLLCVGMVTLCIGWLIMVYLSDTKKATKQEETEDAEEYWQNHLR